MCDLQAWQAWFRVKTEPARPYYTSAYWNSLCKLQLLGTPQPCFLEMGKQFPQVLCFFLFYSPSLPIICTQFFFQRFSNNKILFSVSLRKYCISLYKTSWFGSLPFLSFGPKKYTFTLQGFRENSNLVTVFAHKLRI
jgi:hypothetical protein